MLKQITIIAVSVALAVASVRFTDKAPSVLGNSLNTPKCSVSSTEVATVGNQLSSTILSANEARAFARIQVVPNATNTTSISFDEGASAVLNQGLTLSGNGTSSAEYVEFGRATMFPYTGAVTGITNNGSTTVMVTECSY